MSNELTPATPALAAFVMHRGDPKTEALKHFILLTLHKQLGQVHVWGIDPYKPGEEETRPFHLHLADGSQIKGTLHRTKNDNQGYLPHGERKDKWSVGDDWCYTF